MISVWTQMQSNTQNTSQSTSIEHGNVKCDTKNHRFFLHKVMERRVSNVILLPVNEYGSIWAKWKEETQVLQTVRIHFQYSC